VIPVSERSTFATPEQSLHVPEITRVTVSFAVRGRAVFRSIRIEVRSSRSASVGVVAKLVNVEAVKTFSEAADFTLDLDGARGSSLRQIDDSFDLLARQNANGFDRHMNGRTLKWRIFYRLLITLMIPLLDCD